VRNEYGQYSHGRPCVGSGSVWAGVTQRKPARLRSFSPIILKKRRAEIDSGAPASCPPRTKARSSRRQYANLERLAASWVRHERQRSKIDFIQQLNRNHLADRAGDAELEARIASYELAYRMQTARRKPTDLSSETAQPSRSMGSIKTKPLPTAVIA